MMTQTDKKKTKNNISDTVRDYGNEPYFIKKALESKVFLEKHGFPKELLAKKYGKIGL